LVVHPSHGIGRYAGTQVVERSGVPGALQEFLVLEYAQKATLLVPPDEMDQVRRYVGSGDGRPPLDRLRSEAWSVRTARVAVATRGLAEELLRIQALRQARRGVAIASDAGFEAEFLSAFPYEETPDQREADEAIRSDQRQARPMDRLLCGDVGFGKTELAMRACFRAAAAGRQAAVLVPTTVLALQHEATFRGRMAAFPVRVGMVSRLRTQREQGDVLDALASGECDVVIGTHRLLSCDVAFRDLGLVVVDEEQRFGVEHKGALQRLRSQVDVLSLSATPIPRTLHMAMVGLRDISNLATPPKERLPIRTILIREGEERIRRAILSELSRGGQVFYVHNRVAGIEEACARLRDLVPEARVEFAHGQMSPDGLEDVMVRFARREFDVLMSTTIIESGIDLPNVNTILIERADRFGLAQMHQLRGRVGRFRVQAFCYLLLPRDTPVSRVATRRLRAVEEFSDLGAGFRIALRDLEIRGAGNLLGPEQSGHIAAVGYDLYCRLLASAVRDLKGEAASSLARCEISIPVRALLPETYVDVPELRLGLYQKMARSASDGALREVAGEMADRFGPLPPEARTLLRIHRLRIRAAQAGFSAVGRDADGLRLEVRDPARAEGALARRGVEVRVLAPRRLLVPGPSTGEEALRVLEGVLSV
ncbi:MAG: transcription-repair coupling factor, partial [Planctomycetes bacterium]|nr:transcription-repair coupling factor [Planctomycetota bacterium]